MGVKETKDALPPNGFRCEGAPCKEEDEDEEEGSDDGADWLLLLLIHLGTAERNSAIASKSPRARLVNIWW
jgi:hypothetical protein